jgi:hypothetical protein
MNEQPRKYDYIMLLIMVWAFVAGIAIVIAVCIGIEKLLIFLNSL